MVHAKAGRGVQVVRSLAVLLLVSGASGCISVFAPGSFDWGHGAAPLPEGQTRVQLGGGGGTAAGVTEINEVGPSGLTVSMPRFGAIGGLGAGVAVEHQTSRAVLVRGEATAGCQMPPSADIIDTVASAVAVCPVAIYLGGQLNPGNSRNGALRLRIGGGADLAVTGNESPSVGDSFPYLSGQLGAVLSHELGPLEPYIELHGGAKGYLTYLFFPVLSAGATGGATWKFNDSVSAYALMRGDLLMAGIFPQPSGNVQVGAFLSF
ncbi:MAG: hypothetical protein ACO3JL_12925 [Myxococcota bacterium]